MPCIGTARSSSVDTSNVPFIPNIDRKARLFGIFNAGLRLSSAQATADLRHHPCLSQNFSKGLSCFPSVIRIRSAYTIYLTYFSMISVDLQEVIYIIHKIVTNCNKFAAPPRGIFSIRIRAVTAVTALILIVLLYQFQNRHFGGIAAPGSYPRNTRISPLAVGITGCRGFK